MHNSSIPVGGLMVLTTRIKHSMRMLVLNKPLSCLRLDVRKNLSERESWIEWCHHPCRCSRDI